MIRSADKLFDARQVAVHCLRVALFATIVALIHLQHTRHSPAQEWMPLAGVPPQHLLEFFPEGTSIDDAIAVDRRRNVRDRFGKVLGFALETSPESDHIIGFSGPTNVLIAFGTDNRIAGLAIVSSGDTRDHVREVRKDEAFLNSFTGLTPAEAARKRDLDAVSERL